MSEILEFQAGREARIAGRPRDRRRNADWLRGWDQQQRNFDEKGEKMKQILITTQHRGVFVGEIPDDQDIAARSMPLLNARMVIYWGTTRGLLELCETGPTNKSRISATADIPVLHDITAVFAVSAAAWAGFQA